MIPEGELWRIRPDTEQVHPALRIPQKAASIVTYIKSELDRIEGTAGFEPSMLRPSYSEKKRRVRAFVHETFEEARDIVNSIEDSEDPNQLRVLTAKQDEVVLGLIYAKIVSHDTQAYIPGISVTMYEKTENEKLHRESNNRIEVTLKNVYEPRSANREVTLQSSLLSLSKLFGEATGVPIGSSEFYEKVVKKAEPRKKLEKQPPRKREIWEFNEENPQEHSAWNLSARIVDIDRWSKAEIAKVENSPDELREAFSHSVSEDVREQADQLILDIRRETIDISNSVGVALRSDSPELEGIVAERDDLALSIILACANAYRRSIPLDHINISYYHYFEDEIMHSESANDLRIQLRDPEAPDDESRAITVQSSLFSLADAFSEATGNKLDSKEFYDQVLRKVNMRGEFETSDRFIHRRIFELRNLQWMIDDEVDYDKRGTLIKRKRDIFRELTDIWIERQETDNAEPKESKVDLDIVEIVGDRLRYTIHSKGSTTVHKIPTRWIFSDKYPLRNVARDLLQQEGGIDYNT